MPLKSTNKKRILGETVIPPKDTLFWSMQEKSPGTTHLFCFISRQMCAEEEQYIAEDFLLVRFIVHLVPSARI